MSQWKEGFSFPFQTNLCDLRWSGPVTYSWGREAKNPILLEPIELIVGKGFVSQKENGGCIY
jgi:hypothetical protein